jgi:murein L,D-transpeptidase YcbB/YkuD
MTDPSRFAGLLLSVFLAASCAPVPRGSVTDEARAIAELFETPVQYSPRTMTPEELAAFFASYPEYRADSAAISAFYERRGMQFAWFINDTLTASAEAFLSLSGVADTAGAPVDPLAPHLSALVTDALPEGRAEALCDTCARHLELHLTAEFFRFAERQYGGHFQRDLRELGWFIPRAKKDMSRLIDSLAAGTMDLSAYAPMHPQYQKLRRHLARYQAIRDTAWPALELPRGRATLRPGDSAAVVPAIRARLVLLGDLAADPGGEAYDSGTVEAMRRFQARHGLQEDGVIGPNVVRALNVSPATRLRTMLVNMERLRWVPDAQPANLLLVNIPEFQLHVHEADTLVRSMRVVVGTAATRTVIFSDTVSTIVFSPTWTVPPGMTRRLILPAMRRDPDYLRRENMEIIGGTPQQPIIRQRPGPNNALGRVKFLFPNSYHIYMHDTPARQLFGRDQRAFSQGCIRLADPQWLAEYLLRHDPSWTRSRIERAMVSGRETFVPLTERPPVWLVYFTAWEDREGRLNFRDDIYGHDERLAAELFRQDPPDGTSPP